MSKPCFLNFRTLDEIPLYKRLFWRAFGKRHKGTDVTDYGVCTVTAYELFNVALIWKTDFIEALANGTGE